MQHELHRHHHQGHMTMPGLPLPGLILRHPDMTLGILKRSLDPESLCLHLGRLCAGASCRNMRPSGLSSEYRCQR